MIKAIVFDCFGVLTSDKWKEYVLSLPVEIQQAVHDINHMRGKGQIDRNDFIKHLVKVTGSNTREITRISSAGGNTSKNIELFRYIKDLKKQYKIGLLSNVGSNWVREEFLSPDEQKQFDDILLSYEVNLIKPDSRIFELACERLGTNPEETVLIDDIEAYCQAATGVGMQAIVYQNFVQMKRELEKILG